MRRIFAVMLGMLMLMSVFVSAQEIDLAPATNQDPRAPRGITAQNTVDRMNRIDHNLGSIIERVRREGINVDELESIRAEIRSIIDRMDPKGLRSEQIDIIVEFRGKVNEFNQKVSELLGEREPIRHRSLLLDRMDRVRFNLDEMIRRLEPNYDVEKLRVIAAEMKRIRDQIDKNEPRNKYPEEISQFKAQIGLARDEIRNLIDEWFRAREKS